ncbi:AAA family ATPase [Actinoplanes sp. HUAS TT8]|uniref:helix-turn-helix transcriptional regulator n=1 Tax=Actinoplanes sp. HUAS TT8 TaxID=3447453 RepID=UPI003F5283C7
MTLIGRTEDVASIRNFFAKAGIRGGALLLVGDAGVGKTAVLDEFAAGQAEDGVRVLRAAGVQFEADVNYSALNQLLFPLGDQMPALGEAHRAALRRALGFEVGPVADRLVVSNAALIWLRSVAADAPILIIVDDLHWVDRASAEVLSFVSRRLVGSPIVFLAACRSAERGFFAEGGLPETVLPPLRDAAAASLVEHHFPELAPAVRRRLLAAAAGNPLALLELPSALNSDQRVDFTAMPAVLPLSERLQAMFVSRVRGLPEPCRLMLLLGALGGNTDMAHLRSAGGTLCSPDDLAPAEEKRLVQVSTNRLGFRHPLIGAAVVEASTERERRWAHGALAETTTSPERRVRHLAESAEGANPEIAFQLEVAARALLRQGDAIGAVAALTRAAELSPSAGDRSRRLAEAAYIGADAGGEMAAARRLLGDARRSGSLDAHSLPAAAAAAHLLVNSDGDVLTAHRLLAGAIEAGEHGFDGTNPDLVEAMQTLLLISWWVGADQTWEVFHGLLGRLTPQPEAVLQATAAIFPDPARAAVEQVKALDELIDSVITNDDPTRLVRIGTAAVFADRLPRLREPERHLAQLGREGRSPARRHLGALMHLGIDGFLAGRWDEAWDLAVEGHALCTEHGFRFFHWYFHYVQAMVTAGRGEIEASAQITDDMYRWGTAHQALGVTYFALQARALNDIAAGDYAGAYRHAGQISPPGRLAPYRPTALWAGFDLVEAALHLGHHGEARAHARAMNEAGLGDLSPRLRLLTSAATAMTTDDDLFVAALADPEVEQWPFDVARVRLAYGKQLRRRREIAAAREQLTLAHDALAALEAGPWRDRAANELRATGMTRNSGADAGAPVLTAQEREIADLAGAGLTNKQIAQKLLISHRTVSDHLYKIFPKLGITSRAALRDALSAYEGFRPE